MEAGAEPELEAAGPVLEAAAPELAAPVERPLDRDRDRFVYRFRAPPFMAELWGRRAD